MEREIDSMTQRSTLRASAVLVLCLCIGVSAVAQDPKALVSEAYALVARGKNAEALEKLNAIGSELYAEAQKNAQAAGAAAGPEAASDGPAPGAAAGKKPEKKADVVDADFEVVDDDKKK